MSKLEQSAYSKLASNRKGEKWLQSQISQVSFRPKDTGRCIHKLDNWRATVIQQRFQDRKGGGWGIGKKREKEDES
jgi:hypothetical protein